MIVENIVYDRVFGRSRRSTDVNNNAIRKADMPVMMGQTTSARSRKR